MLDGLRLAVTTFTVLPLAPGRVDRATARLAMAWAPLVGAGLGVFQQFTGINSVMYYGTQLLREAGFSDGAAIIANVANGVLAVVGTALCLFVVIDKVDRRKLIIFGFCATTTVHGLITIAATVMPAGTARASSSS